MARKDTLKGGEKKNKRISASKSLLLLFAPHLLIQIKSLQMLCGVLHLPSPFQQQTPTQNKKKKCIFCKKFQSPCFKQSYSAIFQSRALTPKPCARGQSKLIFPYSNCSQISWQWGVGTQKSYFLVVGYLVSFTWWLSDNCLCAGRLIWECSRSKFKPKLSLMMSVTRTY